MTTQIFLSMLLGLVVGFLGGFIFGYIYCKYLQKPKNITDQDLIIIDCDANPYIPEEWEVVEHRKGGKFNWDPSAVTLYLNEAQKNGGYVSGKELREELKDKPVMNANVLDWLLAHPEHIPEEWKDKYTFFWGTIYRDSSGSLCVRCLCWGGGRWCWFGLWLVDAFSGGGPAPLRTEK